MASEVIVSERKLRVIFDTGVILQAAISDSGAGPASRILRLVSADRLEVFISPRLRSEYEMVLYRDAIRAKKPILTDTVAEELLRFVDETALLAHPVPPYVNFHRDPKDEPILNLAIHIQADFIVARDKDLLDLKDSVKGIRIVDPVTFLRLYEETHPSDERP